jgi:hypothetical protein
MVMGRSLGDVTTLPQDARDGAARTRYEQTLLAKMANLLQDLTNKAHSGRPDEAAYDHKFFDFHCPCACSQRGDMSLGAS